MNKSKTVAMLFALNALCGACKGDVSTTEPNGSGGENADDGKGMMASNSSGRGGSSATAGKPGSSNPDGPSGAMAGSGTSSGTAGSSEGPMQMPTKPNKPAPPPGPPGCGLDNAAFCDTFDTPSPGGNNGDLSDAWQVARISTGNNTGQGAYNVWGATTTEACGETRKNVLPPNDFFFCSGGGDESMRLANSYDDNGGFTVHSYRIRQPFDFTDRTGIITFDVTGMGGIPGGHGIWFNLFISEEPVPAPYQDGGAIALFVKNGIGFEFMSPVCSEKLEANSLTNILVEEDHALAREIPGPEGRSACFKTQKDVLNHGEIHISKNKVEVFMADAGNPGSMRLLKSVSDLNLRFEKGYVSLQHTHYNASKFTGFPAYATFQWDNVGFDGPKYAVERAYEVPDNNLVVDEDGNADAPGPMVNTGYVLGTDAMPSDKQGISADGDNMTGITLKGVDLTDAKTAQFVMNTWQYCGPSELRYRFNGGTWRTFTYPFAECEGLSARTFSMPIELADLKDGDNSFEMWVDTKRKSYNGVIFANAELLVNTEQ